MSLWLIDFSQWRGPSVHWWRQVTVTNSLDGLPLQIMEFCLKTDDPRFSEWGVRSYVTWCLGSVLTRPSGWSNPSGFRSDACSASWGTALGRPYHLRGLVVFLITLLGRPYRLRGVAVFLITISLVLLCPWRVSTFNLTAIFGIRLEPHLHSLLPPGAAWMNYFYKCLVFHIMSTWLIFPNHMLLVF
jgi:hypothetical protein